MKRNILLIILVLVSGFAFAQPANIKKAKSLAKSAEPNFAEATTLIDAALKDETTKNLSETWYVKGFIEFRKWEVQDDKRFLFPPETPDADIMSEGSFNALKYWLVADSLDVLESKNDPKRKGKMLYRKEMADKLTKMLIPINYIANYGSILYKKKEYAASKEVFERFANIPTYEMFKNSDKIKATDSLFIDSTEPIQLTLRMLATKQLNDKDTVAYLKSINEGMQRFPDNIFFLSNMIQYNISMNKEKEALENINKALLIDTKNPVLYYMRGFIYSVKDDKFAEAEQDFNKAIELNPTFTEAIYAQGTLIMKQGDLSYGKASTGIKNPKDAELEMQKAKELYKKAIPILEKARTMDLKGDKDECLRKLMALYYKLGMTDKYNEIKAERAK